MDCEVILSPSSANKQINIKHRHAGSDWPRHPKMLHICVVKAVDQPVNSSPVRGFVRAKQSIPRGTTGGPVVCLMWKWFIPKSSMGATCHSIPQVFKDEVRAPPAGCRCHFTESPQRRRAPAEPYESLDEWNICGGKQRMFSQAYDEGMVETPTSSPHTVVLHSIAQWSISHRALEIWKTVTCVPPPGHISKDTDMS